MFTSLLSVNEFVLADALEVCGIATATIIYHAEQEDFPEASQTLKGATRQRTKLIQSAFTRLQEKCARLEADGVIGVRLVHRPLEDNFFEYTIVGTAVAGCMRGAGNNPFVSTLTTQDYRTLLSSGYRPVGVAFGICIYYQRFHQQVQQKVEKEINVERSDFTRGIYTARQNTFHSLHKEALRLDAEGVLAIEVSTEKILNRSSQHSQGMLIEMTALGTAVVEASTNIFTIDYAVPLSD